MPDIHGLNPELDADLITLNLEATSLGLVPEDFISLVFIRTPGDFCLSLSTAGSVRLSILGEDSKVHHLTIDQTEDGSCSLRGILYGAASSIGELLYNLREPAFNILTSLLGSPVVLRRLINRKVLEDQKILSEDNLKSVVPYNFDKEFKYYRAEILLKGQTQNVILKKALNIMVSDHKNLPIVAPIGAILTGDGYLIYDVIPGSSLVNFLQKMEPQGFDIALKVKLCNGLASVMADLHMADIYHGSLTEENFFVKSRKNRERDVRVLFDGVAGLSPKGVVKKISSAADYSNLAPEVTWTRELTPQTGVYSLGKLFQKIIEKNPHQPNDQNVSLLTDLSSLIVNCLLSKAADRPSMDGVFMTLKAIQGHIHGEHEWKIY